MVVQAVLLVQEASLVVAPLLAASQEVAERRSRLPRGLVVGEASSQVTPIRYSSKLLFLIFLKPCISRLLQAILLDG